MPFVVAHRGSIGRPRGSTSTPSLSSPAVTGLDVGQGQGLGLQLHRKRRSNALLVVPIWSRESPASAMLLHEDRAFSVQLTRSLSVGTVLPCPLVEVEPTCRGGVKNDRN
jgi:hypothetical protein